MLVPSSVHHCETSPLSRIRVDEPDKVSLQAQMVEAGYVTLYAKAIVAGEAPVLPDAKTPEPFRTKQQLAYQCAKTIVEGGCSFLSVDVGGRIIPKQTESKPAQGLKLVK